MLVYFLEKQYLFSEGYLLFIEVEEDNTIVF